VEKYVILNENVVSDEIFKNDEEKSKKKENIL
jgi:hypothetical protein